MFMDIIAHFDDILTILFIFLANCHFTITNTSFKIIDILFKVENISALCYSGEPEQVLDAKEQQLV